MTLALSGKWRCLVVERRVEVEPRYNDEDLIVACCNEPNCNEPNCDKPCCDKPRCDKPRCDEQ